MDRPLFRGHPIQSVAAGFIAMNIATGAAVCAYLVMRVLPASIHTYSLTQTVVALLALSFLVLFIVLHHRQDGRMLTQSQEEIALIISFGLFWLAILIAFRAYSERAIDIGTASEVSLGAKPAEAGFTGGKRPFPSCSNDAMACIVEEWAWF